MQVVFTPSFLDVWNRIPGRNPRTVLLPKYFLRVLLRLFNGYSESVRLWIDSSGSRSNFSLFRLVKYYYTGNEWTFISTFGWKIFVNVAIGCVGMLLSPCVLKSLNSKEKTQPRLMCATFNGKPVTTIVFC